MASCPFAASSSASASVPTTGTHKADRENENDRNSSSSSNNSMGSCPFAQALHDSCDDSASLASLSSAVSSSASASASQPWNDCPVFANRSCPFKDAKSPDEISEILSKLPASHREKSNPHAVWIETLAVLHRDRAMEEYSFSAILGRLIREHHANTNANANASMNANENAQESKDDDDEEEDGSSSSADGDSDGDREEFRVVHHSDNDNQNKDQDPTHSHSRSHSQQEHSPATATATATATDRSQIGRKLSEALKTGTEEAHKEAESVHFVRNFIRGIIDRHSYGLFVAQMFHVYRHLERALEEHAPQHFPDCHFPVQLNRSQALREDVDFWHDNENDRDRDQDSQTEHKHEHEPPISPATKDYLDRIDEVARTRPILLIAHAYTRYLGDLSGGKVLARVAKKALHLEKGPDGSVDGLAFYDFPLLKGSVKAFKDQYRQALNDLQFDNDNDNDNENDHYNENYNDNGETVQAIVREANVAFLLNMRLFEELDVTSSVPGASVRPIADVYARVARIDKHHHEHHHEDATQKPAAPCPFAVSGMGGGFAAGHGHGVTTATTNATANPNANANPVATKTKTCPWPFILLHDPKTGMRHWQTWLTIGLVVAHVYQKCIGA